MFLGKSGIYSALIFVISPRWIFISSKWVSSSPRWVSLFRRWKIYSYVTPRKNFENMTFSPVSQAVSHRGTEAGCLNIQCSYVNTWETQNSTLFFSSA